MSRVIITGANGYIGWKLLKRLYLEKRYQLTAVDIKFDEKKKLPQIKYYEGDLRKNRDAMQMVKKGDTIIHLAAICNREHADENITIMKNVLYACQKNNIKKIIFSSTFQVYGENATVLCNEKCIPAPVSNYGKSKRVCEQLIKEITDKNQMKAIILRLFSVYGKEGTNGIINYLYNKKDQGKIEVANDGYDVRDFVYIDDVIKAILLSLQNEMSANFTVYNIGSGIGTSIKELVKEMKYYLDIEVVYGVLADPIRKVSSNNQKAINELEYKVSTLLASGIKIIVNK